MSNTSNVKVIAITGVENEILEISFTEPPSDRVIHNLQLALESSGWSVRQRRPDGKIVVWECQLPAGDIVTDDTVAVASRAIKMA